MSEGTVATIVILLFVILGCGLLAGCPSYNVYQQRMSGEAEYQRAESSRKIAILEAQAKLESSKALAGAEVERAKGVAQANQIIGDSLKGNEDYLRYLYINNLENSKDQIIYIPTEAGLPILEANRIKH